jgi:hypothetical protein
LQSGQFGDGTASVSSAAGLGSTVGTGCTALVCLLLLLVLLVPLLLLLVELVVPVQLQSWLSRMAVLLCLVQGDSGGAWEGSPSWTLVGLIGGRLLLTLLLLMVMGLRAVVGEL